MQNQNKEEVLKEIICQANEKGFGPNGAIPITLEFAGILYDAGAAYEKKRAQVLVEALKVISLETRKVNYPNPTRGFYYEPTIEAKTARKALAAYNSTESRDIGAKVNQGEE